MVGHAAMDDGVGGPRGLEDPPRGFERAFRRLSESLDFAVKFEGLVWDVA